MSFSDDFASSSARFSGDDSNSDLDAPDVVRQSPITNERVVDTQSGFLIVIKQIDKRLALSVKRRVGTPPTSSISLTPDESLQLSVVLADYVVSLHGKAVVAGRLPAAVEHWLGNLGNSANNQAEYDPDSDRLHREDEDDIDDVKAPDYPPKASIRRHRLRPNTGLKIAAAAAVAFIVVGGAFLVWSLTSPTKHAQVENAPVSATLPSLLDDASVDKFTRTFVSEMLDFNQDTYRSSQVKAMAHMSTTLLNSYWADTKFPRAQKELKKTNDSTLLITKVVQDRVSPKNKDVDVFAEFVQANSKISTPVHLKLTISVASDNELEVQSMRDVGSEK